MIKLKIVLYVCFVFFIVLTLISCGKSKIGFPEECEPYLFYELSVTDSISRFLNKEMNSSEKYIALKRMSEDGYELIVLSLGENSGVFAASSPIRNVSVSLERNQAIKIFNNIVGNDEISMDNYSNSSTLHHSECAFVRLKDSTVQDAFVLNASKIEYSKNRSNEVHNQLGIYFGIEELLSVYFPDFRKYTLEEFIPGSKVTYEIIDGYRVPKVELDQRIPNIEQKKAFNKAIFEDPFFELEF